MIENSDLDFAQYPTIGHEDWRYTFSTAQVRALETTLITKSIFLDMANSPSYEEALECLSGSSYNLPAKATLSDIEQILLEKRQEARKLFEDLMIDKELEGLVRAREDFANMRLAVRRVVTDKPIGTDYSNDGSVSASIFEEVFEQESYHEFPMHMQEAVESAILSYYENKDIRQIDYAIDEISMTYMLDKAIELQSPWLASYARTQIDLTNIKTMLRLKFIDSEQKGPFIPFGFVSIDLFLHGLNVGYDGIVQTFYPTPYSWVVDGGVSYLVSKNSFLRLEALIEKFMFQKLKTLSITAGPQPVIAYLYKKEHEIRNIRMILTAKKNLLDSEYILDRLSFGRD